MILEIRSNDLATVLHMRTAIYKSLDKPPPPADNTAPIAIGDGSQASGSYAVAVGANAVACRGELVIRLMVDLAK